MNTMKSEREAEMKYQNAINTISEQERQIRELSWGAFKKVV